jgi:hypothetical protein
VVFTGKPHNNVYSGLWLLREEFFNGLVSGRELVCGVNVPILTLNGGLVAVQLKCLFFGDLDAPESKAHGGNGVKPRAKLGLDKILEDRDRPSDRTLDFK